jgi:hypothetical protein
MKRRAITIDQVERVKAISSDALAGSGKTNPVHVPEATGTPKDGLIISPFPMAQAIIEGRKTLVVKTQPFSELDDGTFYLISGRKALGIVHLGKQAMISKDQFAALEPQHGIDEATRAKWCKQYKGWCEGPFYVWRVDSVIKYDDPMETNVGPGPQVLVHNVQIKAPANKRIEKFKM